MNEHEKMMAAIKRAMEGANAGEAGLHSFLQDSYVFVDYLLTQHATLTARLERAEEALRPFLPTCDGPNRNDDDYDPDVNNECDAVVAYEGRFHGTFYCEKHATPLSGRYPLSKADQAVVEALTPRGAQDAGEETTDAPRT